MRTPARTPEGRLRVKAVLTAHRSGHPPQWVRDLAHELFGVPATEDLCLTVLDKPQLVRLVDEVVLRTGGTPGEHRRGPWLASGARRRHRRDPAGVVIQLASATERSLILQQGATLFGSSESPAFREFLRRMTGKSDVRLLASDQAEKLIQAMRSMEDRGWRPRAAGRADVSDSSDPSDTAATGGPR